MTPLTRRFYRRDPVVLARALLGKHLVRVLRGGTRIRGRIVEVEAYLGAADRAAHTYRGRRTQRNASMFLDGGHAYVYFTYGMHFCFNITADREDVPTACLVRALEPLEGIEAMRRHREKRGNGRRALRDTDLCSGPAKLAQALAIDRDLDGIDLAEGGRLYLCGGGRVDPGRIQAAARVGVSYAGAWARRRLRFYIRGNLHVSVR